MPRIAAVIVAFNRPALLRRLISSLADQGKDLVRLIVVNNGESMAPEELRAMIGCPLVLLEPGENLGTGEGLAFGLRTAFDSPEVTHAWILDDDATANEGALSGMVEAQCRARAGAVAPLIVSESGRIGWYPGPMRDPAWRLLRAGATPEEFRRIVGTDPLRWNWATWASLLVSREAVAAVGFPRRDLWYQATDTEYTLRLSYRFPCVLAPAATCRHLPPDADRSSERLKAQWRLQNSAFVSMRLRHGWRALRHLPGNHLRHALRYGAWGESVAALWYGGVRGRPVPRSAYLPLIGGQD